MRLLAVLSLTAEGGRPKRAAAAAAAVRTVRWWTKLVHGGAQSPEYERRPLSVQASTIFILSKLFFLNKKLLY